MGLFGKSSGKVKEESVIKNGVFVKWNGDSTIMRIPDEVTTIGTGAFWDKAFNNVTEIFFPASLQKIEMANIMTCFQNRGVDKVLVFRGSGRYVQLFNKNLKNWPFVANRKLKNEAYLEFPLAIPIRKFNRNKAVRIVCGLLVGVAVTVKFSILFWNGLLGSFTGVLFILCGLLFIYLPFAKGQLYTSEKV